MRLSQTIIFFGIVLTIYGFINFYILKRGLAVVPSNYKFLFLTISLIVVFSFIVGRLLESKYASFLTDTLIWIGSFWFAFMFYFFLSLLLIDLLRLLDYLFKIFPSFITKDFEATKRIAAIVVISLVTIVIFAGFLNTKKILVKNLSLTINKPAGKLKSLNVALASDIHLGTINGKRMLSDIIGKINSLNPDIILLAGDIIDEDVQPVIRKNAGKPLTKLKSKYGTFAITGNHEYIGGADAACKYLADHGLTMLRDSAIKIGDAFYIIGREDRSIKMFGGKSRKPLNEIMDHIDKSLPIILMDHQPIGLNNAVQNGVDLQVSGHTHNGQLWPLNFITGLVYEIDWGYLLKGKTHFYVSCGAGGWGPPIRTGSRPEIINIHLDFIKE